MTHTLSSIQGRIRAATDPAAVAQLETMRPARAWRDLALDWALILAAIALAAAVPTPWAWIVAFVLIGSGQYRLFVLGHEGIHGCLHPNLAVNDRVARWLIYGPLFVGFEDSRRAHLGHHKELGTATDPERYIHSVENKNSRGKMLWFYSGLATFTRTVRKVLPVGAFSTATGMRSFITKRVPVAIAQPVILGGMLLAGLPAWAWLVLWVAPIYPFVFVADEIRTFCDHAVAKVPDDDADPERLIRYVPNALEAWLLAPHKVHYQAEHHLWPSVPYYNLEAAVPLTAGHDEVEERPSYFGFLRKAWRALPLT